MRPLFFRRPDRTERTVVRGPHPVAVFASSTVDTVWSHGLSGHAGAVRIGRNGGRARVFSGELGPHQFFRGGVPLGVGSFDRKGFNTALPNTHGPVTDPNPVMNLLGRIPSAAASLPI